MRILYTCLIVLVFSLHANIGVCNTAFYASNFSQVQTDEIQLATKTEGDRILLSWNIFSEKKVASIQVNRSENGKDFSMVYRTSSSTFNFTDYLVQPLNSAEQLYYSVKVVFSDGSTASSSIKEINLEEERSLKPSVYTAGNQINVEFYSAERNAVVAQIFNTTSRLVKQERFVPFQGSNKLTIDAGNLRSGMYFLRLEQNGKVTTTKFFIR